MCLQLYFRSHETGAFHLGLYRQYYHIVPRDMGIINNSENSRKDCQADTYSYRWRICHRFDFRSHRDSTDH